MSFEISHEISFLNKVIKIIIMEKKVIKIIIMINDSKMQFIFLCRPQDRTDNISS